MDSKSYRYKILIDKNLIIKYYQGTLAFNDLLEFVRLTGNDGNFKPTMFVLNDIRDAKISLDNNEINQFIDTIKKEDKLYAKRKIIFLTDKPHQVVFSTLIDILKEESLINLMTVSTVQAALNYLEISHNDYTFIEDTLICLRSE